MILWTPAFNDQICPFVFYYWTWICRHTVLSDQVVLYGRLYRTYLISQLIQASVLASHENASIVGANDVHYIGVVCGDREQRLGEEVHLPTPWISRHACQRKSHITLYHQLLSKVCEIYNSCEMLHYLFINGIILKYMKPGIIRLLCIRTSYKATIVSPTNQA